MNKRSNIFFAIITAGFLVLGVASEVDAKPHHSTTLTVWGRLPSNCPADTVVAVPVINGNLNQMSLENSKTCRLNRARMFRLILEKTSDWLLVLINSSAEGPERFVGQIGFRTDEPNNTLILLPVSVATTSRLHILRLSASGELWLTERPINESAFSLTREELLFLAENDDYFLNVKNLILNSYASGSLATFYTLRPDFSWYGNYAETQNAFMSPIWYIYRSYNFQLDSDSTEVTMDQGCGNYVPRVSLELYPPTGSTVVSKNPSFTYNDLFPISNNNATCISTPDGFVEARDEDFFATNRYGNISYSFGANIITNPVPSGFWRYLVAGIERASFDIAVATPEMYYGRLKGVVPALRVNTNADGKILSLDISWYVFDSGTVTYTAVTDLSILEHLIGSANIFLSNDATSSRRYESIAFNPLTQTNVTPVNTWYFANNGTPEEQADEIGVFYSSAGIGYFFKLTKFVYPEGSPAFILPLPEETLPLVTKGQQYNSCSNFVRHTGLDFGFTFSPSEPFLYYDVIAPCDGLVKEIMTHPIGSNVGVTVEFLFNRNWGTFIAFEPFSSNQQIADLQNKEIVVFANQVVRRGEIIGRLVVPQTEFPHIHWQVFSIDPVSLTNTDVCPRQYSVLEAQDQLDEMYGNSAEGIVGWLSGPYGPFTDSCLVPPPPECITPP